MAHRCAARQDEESAGTAPQAHNTMLIALTNQFMPCAAHVGLVIAVRRRNPCQFLKARTVDLGEFFRKVGINALDHDVVPDVSLDRAGESRILAVEALPLFAVAR